MEGVAVKLPIFLTVAYFHGQSDRFGAQRWSLIPYCVLMLSDPRSSEKDSAPLLSKLYLNLGPMVTYHAHPKPSFLVNRIIGTSSPLSLYWTNAL